MLIKELMPILRAFYHSYDQCIYDRPVALNPTEHQLVGLYETRGDDHYVRFVTEESVDYGRGSFGHDKSVYRHEGHVVYRNFNSVTFRNDFSLDYELLCYGDPLRCKYIGLIIKLEGKWRLYIADSHMFVLDNDFETAKEAKEYFVKQHEKDLDFWKMVEEFLYDVKVDFKIV